MTLVKQGHESISTSHVAFLTPFLPREGCGRGWRSEEGGRQMTNPGIVAITQCRVRAREWNSVQGVTKNRSTQKLGEGGSRLQGHRSSPSFLKFEVKSISWPLRVHRQGCGLDLELNLYVPIYVCVWRGGEERETIIILIVEITDPDHYRNLISCFAGSGLISPPNFMGICSFPRHPADTQIN